MVRTGLGRPFAAVLVVLLGACGGPGASLQPTGSPSTTPAAASTPSAAPSASPAPSPAATPSTPPVAAATPTPNPDPCARVPYAGPWTIAPLLPGSAVRVLVAELNLRNGPCTAASKVGIVKKGQILVAWDGLYAPIKANGYVWYSVLVLPNTNDGKLPALPSMWFPEDTDTDGGWIAANDGDTSFVTPVAPRCPSTVDLTHVAAMLPAEWLECFKAPIVLQGTYGCGGCGGDGGPQSEPPWLADTFEFEQIHVRWGAYSFQPIGLHFKPAGPAKPPEGSIIKVTVHVDDPAAQTCKFTWAMDEPVFKTPAEMAIGWCRERLVVDTYEVIGTDPDFP